MKKSYTSFVHTDVGSVRYISGMTAYDEKLIGGRLVARYLNACGQILPEMHLHDTLFYGEDENVFALTVEGKELSDGWRMEKVEVQEDRASVTLLHESCPVRVEVTTRGDGKDWLTRELMVQNLSDCYLPIDFVAPLCGKLWRHRFDNGILSYTPEECGSTNDRIFEVGYAPLCSWGKEGDYGFHPLRNVLRYNGGMNGRSGWSRPAYVLKNNLNGQLLCCELAYSGNWEMQLQPVCNDEGAALRHQIGIIAPEGESVCVLSPGEIMRVPAVHFTLCAQGHAALIHSRHRFVREQIMPQKDPIGRCLIEANHRGYLCDRENEADIKRDISVAAAAGVELYVVDAGWYGKDPNIWFNNVGDWFAGNWLPNDLQPIIAHAKSLGMKFGLWMEFEAAGASSEVRREHPEFFLKRYGEEVADGRAIDLSNPEALAWVEEQISSVISRYQLDMFRIDHNHYICDGGTREVGGYVENLTFRYMENLYAMLERITNKFPQVSFQNCAAGGGRLDLGILRYFHHTEISDWARPPREMRIFNGMITQLPPEIQLRISGTEVCEHVQDSDMTSQMHSIMQGRMIFRGISPTKEELAQPLLELVQNKTQLYKQELRPILTGNCLVYRHDAQNGVLNPEPFSANEYALPDGSAAFAVVHKLSVQRDTVFVLRLQGVRTDCDYAVLCDRSGDRFVMSGRELKQTGICLHLDHCLDSELVLVKKLR